MIHRQESQKTEVHEELPSVRPAVQEALPGREAAQLRGGRAEILGRTGAARE